MRFVGLHVVAVGALDDVHIPLAKGLVDRVFEFVQVLVPRKQTLFRRDIIAMFIQEAAWVLWID